MADKKISQLTTLAQADVAVTADFLPIVDTSATETKKATPQALVQAGATGATLPVALGAVGTPSYTFTGDLNTGMWSPAADTVAVSTGGSERLRVDSSGNVGIGTASPSAYGKFVVVGTGDICNLDTTSGATGIAFFETGSGRARIRTLNGSDGLAFLSGATERMRITATGNIVAGASAALATNATDGFLYVPTCAGTPTGTPTAITGMAPIVVDTTNNKMYFYSGGQWRDAGP